MAWSNNLENVTKKSAADLATHQFKIVELDSSGFVGLALAGKGYGVIQNIPSSLEAGTVAVKGQTKVIAGAAIAVGDRLRANSGGWVISVASGAAHPADMITMGRCEVAASSGGIGTMDIDRDLIDIASGAAWV